MYNKHNIFRPITLSFFTELATPLTDVFIFTNNIVTSMKLSNTYIQSIIFNDTTAYVL